MKLCTLVCKQKLLTFLVQSFYKVNTTSLPSQFYHPLWLLLIDDSNHQKCMLELMCECVTADPTLAVLSEIYLHLLHGQLLNSNCTLGTELSEIYFALSLVRGSSETIKWLKLVHTHLHKRLSQAKVEKQVVIDHIYDYHQRSLPKMWSKFEHFIVHMVCPGSNSLVGAK